MTKKLNNQIIVAMDNEIQDGIGLIRKTINKPEIYGYKIGSLWILDRGIDVLKDVSLEKGKNQKIILDMQKWGTDIPDIIEKQIRKVAYYVDEIICCPMGAGSDSLKQFAFTCIDTNVKPICVLEMTQSNSSKYLADEYKSLIIEDCYNYGIKSFVVPATKEPDIMMKAIFEFYFGKNNANLYATGFKVQGGQTEPMVEFGVTKFIAGRAIYDAEDSIKEIDSIYKEINKVL